MKNKINKSWLVVSVLFVFVLIFGCSDNDKSKKESPASAVSGSIASGNTQNVIAGQGAATDAAVSVNGKILKKSELERLVKDRFAMLKEKIPADKQKEFKEDIKKRLVEEFIMRTILTMKSQEKKLK